MKEKAKQKRPTTPYDDVFRTLIERCRKSTLLFLNEMFRNTGYIETYTGDEKIELLNNEHMGELGKSGADKRISDSHIRVYGRQAVNEFHIECQSTHDDNIIFRIFEYSARMAQEEALENGTLQSDVLEVNFAYSGLLYLKEEGNTPNELRIRIHTPGGSASYVVPVVRMREYTADDIIDRRLYFLIPFFSFTVYQKFAMLERDEEQRRKHIRDLDRLLVFLQQEETDGKIGTYESIELAEAVEYVEKALITVRWPNLKKGVNAYMSGKVLEFRIDKVYKQGREEGREEGREQGREEGVLFTALATARSMFEQGLSFEVVRKCTDKSVTDEQLQEIEKEVTGSLMQG